MQLPQTNESTFSRILPKNGVKMKVIFKINISIKWDAQNTHSNKKDVYRFIIVYYNCIPALKSEVQQGKVLEIGASEKSK